MLIIKDLNKYIKKNLEMAEFEAKQALLLKDSEPEIAKFMYEKSKVSIGKVNDAHKQIVSKITAYKTKVGEPPADMQARYDWVHSEMIEKATDIEILQNIFIKQ